MGWQQNKDTIVTNIVQQSTSLLIFLAVPNLLPVEGFGQITFVVTLLSFMTFADFGLAFVYGRKMPAIYASGSSQDAQRWNETVFTFRMCTALLFGIMISAIYFFKYQALLNSMMLFFIPPLSVIASFYIAQHTALSSFSAYRKINSFQAIARLVTIPCVMLFGLLGWFLAQLVASLLTVVKIFRNGWLPKKLRIDSRLLKEHFVEGILLGAITTLWLQLLASGKLFASFLYSDVVIAQYGLMNTGYQIVASLIIATFIPQTVKVYMMIESSIQEALEYVFQTILYTTPIVFGLTIISREAAPYVLAYFFPKYHVDPIILDALIFSLPIYPIIVTLGTILIAQKKSVPYLLLITFSLIVNWVILVLLEPYYGYRAAAIAQLGALFLYSALLLALIFYSFKNDIEKKLIKLIQIYGSLAGMFALYFSARYVLVNQIMLSTGG